MTEEKRAERQWILFLGAGKVFADGMSDPTTPMGPFMKQLRNSNAMVAEPTAAALMAAGLRQHGDGPDSPVGFPFFVYVLDSDGFRRTRRVEKGQRVTFDSQEQNKRSEDPLLPAK